MKRFSIVAAVLIAGLAAGEEVDRTDGLPASFKGLYVGPNAAVGSRVWDSTTNKVTRILAGTATIDFASTRVGVVESSGITVTGAQANDECVVGVPAAAGALKARFECYVSAADTVKVKFTPMDFSAGVTAALGGESPAVITATVSASSTCTCTNVGATAAIAANGCAVGLSGTTLTITSANGATNTVNYTCSAPVDPASGTYYVYVKSHQ